MIGDINIENNKKKNKNIEKPSLLYSLRVGGMENNEGISKEDAMIKYIKYTSELINKYD